MSKLEDLVPPPELCNLIPEGAFSDSALIWHVQGSPVGYMKELERRDELHAERFGVVLPAPTLAEIIEALPKIDDRENCIAVVPDFPDDGEKRILGEAWEVGYTTKNCAKDRNPAIAALKLWKRLVGGKNA